MYKKIKQNAFSFNRLRNWRLFSTFFCLFALSGQVSLLPNSALAANAASEQIAATASDGAHTQQSSSRDEDGSAGHALVQAANNQDDSANQGHQGKTTDNNSASSSAANVDFAREAGQANNLTPNQASNPALENDTVHQNENAKLGTDTQADAPSKKDEKSWFVRFVESKISGSGRKIRLTNISDILSSTPSVGKITIADNQGVWLTINNAQLNWNRLSLLLGRLSINSLNADSIDIIRMPRQANNKKDEKQEDDFLTKLAKGNITLPSLPLDINIASLEVPQLNLSPELAGRAAQLSAKGSIELNGKVLAANIKAERQGEETKAGQDAPQSGLENKDGHIQLRAHYDIAQQNLTVDSYIDEAKDGILANLLKIEGRPALNFSAKGGGKNGDFKINLAMLANNQSVLDGVLSAYNDETKPQAASSQNKKTNTQTKANGAKPGDRKIFNLSATGQLERIAPKGYKSLLADKTELHLQAAIKNAGGVRLDSLLLNGGAIYLAAQAETTADGFLRQLKLDGGLGQDAAPARAASFLSAKKVPNQVNANGQSPMIAINHDGKPINLNGARFNLDYGQPGEDKWHGNVAIRQLAVNQAKLGDMNILVDGAAENLDIADKRYISASLKGNGRHLTLVSNNKTIKLPDALMAVTASWNSGAPLTIQDATISAGSLKAHAQGAIWDKRFDGSAYLLAQNADDIAAIFGRKIAGKARLNVNGSLELKTGAFNADIAGNVDSIKTDNAGINNLLASDITITGGLSHDKSGFMAKDLRLANQQIQIYANGAYTNDANDKAKTELDFDASLADMRLLVPFIEKLNQKNSPLLAADSSFNQAGIKGTKRNAAQLANEAQMASGALHLKGAVRGHNYLTAVALNAAIPEGVWNGQSLKNINFNFNGFLDDSSGNLSPQGLVKGSGAIGGKPLDLETSFAKKAGKWDLNNIAFNWDKNSLNGQLQQHPSGLWNGRLALKTKDLASLAQLAFMQGTGQADIAVQLNAKPRQTANDAAGTAQKGDNSYGQNLSIHALVDNLSLTRVSKGQQASQKTQNNAKPLFFLENLTGAAEIDNLYHMPRVKGKISGQNLIFGDYGIDRFAINSQNEGLTSDISLQASLTNGLEVLASGIASPYEGKNPVSKGEPDANWQFILNKMSVRGLPDAQAIAKTASHAQATGQNTLMKHKKTVKTDSLKRLYEAMTPFGVNLDSQRAAKFTFAQGQILRVDGLELKLSQDPAHAKKTGKNKTTVIKPAIFKLDGDVTKTPDLTAFAQNVPLAWVDLVRPDLGLRGVLNANAHVAGTRDLPLLDFDLNINDITANVLSQAGLPAVNLNAKGRTHDETLTIDSSLLAKQKLKNGQTENKLDARVNGQVLLADKQLHLNAAINDLSLSILEKIVQKTGLNQRNLQGQLNAKAAITGSYTNPQAKFSTNIAGLSSTMLRSGGAAPIAITTEGVANKKALQLDAFKLDGPGRVGFSASGHIPYSGTGLKLQTQGKLPLALANGLLSAQGAKLGGFLNLNSSVSGALQNPQMQGNFDVEQGQFFVGPFNLRLKPIEMHGRLSGNDILLDKAILHSYTGGQLDVSGSIGVSSQEKFPLNLQTKFNDFSYSDGQMLTATLGGGLNIGGAILQDLAIGGKINIECAELRIPEFLGSANLLEIENKYPTLRILQTQKYAGLKTKADQKQAQKSEAKILPSFNIEVSAPNQIFVRGRGLDAEMGGDLKLEGRLDHLMPTGSLNLIRGRFDILAQRLVFTEGKVTLAGNLNPDLHFVATSKGKDVEVTITLSGTPTSLDMELSSDPSLPQDEILARLIFGRSFSELSAFQIAQLVDATAELTGVTSRSVFGTLRAKTGLDQLDVNVDSEGNTDVSAGSYIMDKVYLGVETSSDGESKGTANIDITPNLKAKGTIGSDANSDYGIFYERDY